MKNKTKKVLIIVSVCLAVILVASLLLLRGCEDRHSENTTDGSTYTQPSETAANTEMTEVETSKPEESTPTEHIHKYADAWSSNETDHWRECIYGDKADIASHAFGEWVTAEEATETLTGSKERICTICGYRETATVPMLSHTHRYSENWHSNETDHWHECNCSDKADIAGHTYGQWTVTKEATEKEEGSKYHTCEICAYQETSIIPLLSHTHAFGDWKSNATSHWKECECGEKAELSAHTYGDWETLTEAGCISAGSKKHTCTSCGYSETSVIPATGHHFGDWINDAASHWKECNCGEKAELSAHTYGDWETITEMSCTTAGTRKQACADCGYSKTETLPAAGHHYVSVVTPPTDVEQGYTTHTCSRCGDSYIDSYVEPTGDYSKGLSYAIWPDRLTCTVTGIGTCKDRALKIPPVIDGYKVIALASNAFKDCTNITSVTIPNSVTSISHQAFYGCTSLSQVTIPSSVTEIYSGAFRDCTSLTSITIPNNVTYIGGYAFRNCVGLTDITIPYGVTTIDSGAFYDCTNITSITIPNSVTFLGSGAFWNCTRLAQITIGNGIALIDAQTFYNCTSLVSITIPSSVATIEFEAFRNCTSLTNITIPKSVTYIGNNVFWDCANLTNVYYQGTEADWEKLGIDFESDCLTNVQIHYNS
jgi:hypothetical protein